MLQRINDLPAGIEGIRASGTVSGEDYERVMLPLLRDARSQGKRLRFLYHLGPDFESFSAGAAWEDASLGLRYLRRFEACAIVSDVSLIRESSKLLAPFIPCPVRTFPNDGLADAISWLGSVAQAAKLSHRMLPGGVVVVEIASALRASDFDALATAVDSWIEAHGTLHGIVIHTREFPGWEDPAGFFRHVRFVRDHHLQIGKVAFAADGTVAHLVARLAEHFAGAEVKHFDYGALGAAIAWASA
jgi:hypothetical protein